MQTLDIRKDLIRQFRELNKKKNVLHNAEFQNTNWTSLKSEIQQNLDNLKLSSKIYDVIAYLLLIITGVISFMKVLDIGSMLDLNKGALLIFLTVTNTIVSFSQKIKIGRLEKQFLLIDILEKFDSNDNIL